MQDDWLWPRRGDWMARLDEVLLADARLAQTPALLAAHSLGCLLVAAWAAHSRHTARVAGALLVAPPDTERADFPPQLAGWRDIVRYAPADGLYVDRDEDGAPEAAIGRLPVRSVVELQSLLAKLVAAAAPKRALLVSPADESDAPFRAVHEGFAARWPAGWTLDRAYVDDLGLDSTRAALGNALNQRLGVLSFVGHSAPTTWSFDPVLSTADLVGRTGLADLVVQWGCWNSYFVAPTANTLAHGFLLTPGSGAAAVIGVTSLTDLKSHEALGNLLHPELAAGARIGDALRLAKMQLAAQGERYRDILIAATLLGDPAQPVP